MILIGRGLSMLQACLKQQGRKLWSERKRFVLDVGAAAGI